MKLNRKVIITSILEHESTFLKLVDFIDQESNGFLEVREDFYLRLYNDEICKDEHSNTHQHLTIESLEENGVFIHNNRSTGMISISSFLIEMLRYIDINRAKSLTHSDFEDMRKRLVSNAETIRELLIGTTEFEDAKHTFNATLSEIHSKIKQNVAGLHNEIERLSSDYKAYTLGEGEINLLNLYERVTEIQERYVIPCHDFISPHMQMKQTKTFTQAMESLLVFFEDSGSKGSIKLSSQLLNRKVAITSYYKDIDKLRRKLSQYSTTLNQNKDKFLAIESAFDNLMKDVELLRHGKQRGKYLTVLSECISEYHTFDGIPQSKARFSTKFNWSEIQTPVRFGILIEDLETMEINSVKKTSLKAIKMPEKLEQERMVRVDTIFSHSMPKEPVNDIHKYIGETLKTNLKDFHLVDVLYGLESFFARAPTSSLKHQPVRNRMIYQEYYLDHLVTEFIPEQLCTAAI